MLGLVAVRNGFELTSGIVSGIDFWTQSNHKHLIGKEKRVRESIPITRSISKAAHRFRWAAFVFGTAMRRPYMLRNVSCVSPRAPRARIKAP